LDPVVNILLVTTCYEYSAWCVHTFVLVEMGVSNAQKLPQPPRIFRIIYKSLPGRDCSRKPADRRFCAQQKTNQTPSSSSFYSPLPEVRLPLF